jgi:hypothetical protein
MSYIISALIVAALLVLLNRHVQESKKPEPRETPRETPPKPNQHRAD